MYAIKTSALTKHYGKKIAIKDINLKISPGSIFGLLGPNGAGKTTTLQLLLGLKKPTSGKIEIYGQPMLADNLTDLPHMAYVSDQCNLYPHMRGKQLLEFTARFHPLWDHALVTNSQKLFKLPLEDKIATYSHGMKKLLAITIALASQAKLLILDEPTIGLDPLHKKEVLALLIDQVAETERTILISTHQLSTLERSIDRFAILNRGSLVMTDSMVECKEKYFRIHIAWPTGELPKTVAPELFVQAEQQGQAWLFVSNNPALTEMLKQSHPSFCKLYPMSLEEIFFLYTQGKGEEDDSL